MRNESEEVAKTDVTPINPRFFVQTLLESVLGVTASFDFEPLQQESERLNHSSIAVIKNNAMIIWFALEELWQSFLEKNSLSELKGDDGEVIYPPSFLCLQGFGIDEILANAYDSAGGDAVHIQVCLSYHAEMNECSITFTDQGKKAEHLSPDPVRYSPLNALMSVSEKNGHGDEIGGRNKGLLVLAAYLEGEGGCLELFKNQDGDGASVTLRAPYQVPRFHLFQEDAVKRLIEQLYSVLDQIAGAAEEGSLTPQQREVVDVLISYTERLVRKNLLDSEILAELRQAYGSCNFVDFSRIARDVLCDSGINEPVSAASSPRDSLFAFFQRHGGTVSNAASRRSSLSLFGTFEELPPARLGVVPNGLF